MPIVFSYTIQPPPIVGMIPLPIIATAGFVVLVLAFNSGRNAKSIRGTFVGLMIIGVVQMGVGAGLYCSVLVPSHIIVGT